MLCASSCPTRKRPVSVTLIKPAAINTDFAHHAHNDADREPKLPPPLYAPKEVAFGILHAAAHPKRDIYIGGAGRLFSFLNRIAPALMDQLSKTLIPQSFPRRATAPSRGRAARDGARWKVDSDHPGFVRQTSFYTRLSVLPGFGIAVAALLGLGLAALFKHEPKRKSWF